MRLKNRYTNKEDSLMKYPDLNFNTSIDLWDETLREGAERGTVSSTLQEKIKIAVHLSNIGIRTIVVGMFPEVPANHDLLKALLEKQNEGVIASDVRFVVISHVGKIAEKTKKELESLELSLSNVWLMLINSVSNQQITYMFPTIANSDSKNSFVLSEWERLNINDQRQLNIDWLERFLSGFSPPDGIGGLVLGMLDYFRADIRHIKDIIHLGISQGFSEMRMVDTAGTCTPHQIAEYVGSIVTEFPQIDFFGHFHNDFGLATANAMLGLSSGLKGVDVSVGGFANRAGHPPLAEIAMSLRELYGYKLKNFDYRSLCKLSRLVEETYCLVETPTQPITGVITHSVTSGIRTQLIKKCPTIFDIIEPKEVGADLKAMFGIRSGIDGIRRLIQLYDLDPEHNLSNQDIKEIYQYLNEKWERESAKTKETLRLLIEKLNNELVKTAFLESEVIDFIQQIIVKEKSYNELA